jgi:hypothetical protein
MTKVIILSILVVSLVAGGLWLLLTNKDSNAQPQQHLGWSSDDNDRCVDLLRMYSEGQLTDDVLKEMIKYISIQMTYKQFLDMKKEDKLQMLKDLTIKVSGVKGKWADFVKKQLVKKLMVLYNNGVCTLCIVGRLEQEYDPTKFLYDASSFDIELSHVMEECVHECQKDN